MGPQRKRLLHQPFGGPQNWLGLSGTTDCGLMPRILEDDYTFVTNNAAADFGKLHGQAELHAGLVIFVPQVAPELQRRLFDTLLGSLNPEEQLVNEVIEIVMEGEQVVFERYALPG